MAMLNWQGWAANFQGWGSAGAVTPPVVVTPDVGHVARRGGRPEGAKRKRYLIDGRLLLLTDDELHAHLLRLLRRKKAQQEAPPSARREAKLAPKAAVEPIIVPADFGLLSPQMQAQPYAQVAADLARENWAQSQPEILRALHELAAGLDADTDEDDETILLLM
jgi:hypothetical protein